MIESNNIHIRDLEPILFNPCDFFSEEDGDQWGKNSYSAAVSFIEEKSLEGYSFVDSNSNVIIDWADTFKSLNNKSLFDLGCIVKEEVEENIITIADVIVEGPLEKKAPVVTTPIVKKAEVPTPPKAKVFKKKTTIQEEKEKDKLKKKYK
jgi:hypothetical protein